MNRDDVNTLERAFYVLDGLRGLPLADALADGALDFLDGAALLGMGQAPADHEPVLLDAADDVVMPYASTGQSTPLQDEIRVPT